MRLLISLLIGLLLFASIALAQEATEETTDLVSPPARQRIGVMVTDYGQSPVFPTASTVDPSEKMMPLYFMKPGSRSLPSLERYPHMYYLTADRMTLMGMPMVFETKYSGVKPMRVMTQPHTYRVAYPSPEQTKRWQTISQTTSWSQQRPQAAYIVLPQERYDEGSNPTMYSYSYREYTDSMMGTA